MCSFGVKLSSEESHQTHPAVPTTPTRSHACRNLRRWK
jgi:hypothetical protein